MIGSTYMLFNKNNPSAMDPNAGSQKPPEDTGGSYSSNNQQSSNQGAVNTSTLSTGGFEGDTTDSYNTLANTIESANSPALDVEGMNNDVAAATNVKKGSSYVDPGSLVEDRLQSMLGDKNNVMNKRLQAMGTMGANRAGLASSSMGVGAAIGNSANTLLKVAQQDSKTLNDFAGRQQKTENAIENYKGQGAVSGQLNRQEQDQNRQNMAFKTAVGGLDKATTARFEKIKTEWAQSLDTMKITAAEAADLRKYGSEIIENHQVSVENLLGNTTFLGLGSKATKNILNNLANGMTGSLQYLNNTAGVSTAVNNSYLRALLGTFTFGGNYSYKAPKA